MLLYFLYVLSIHCGQYGSCVEDGQQMYSGGSVIDEASIIDPDISSPSPDFHRKSKSAKFGLVFNIIRL